MTPFDLEKGDFLPFFSSFSIYVAAAAVVPSTGITVANVDEAIDASIVKFVETFFEIAIVAAACSTIEVDAVPPLEAAMGKRVGAVIRDDVAAATNSDFFDYQKLHLTASSPRIFIAPHLAIDTTFASKIVGVLHLAASSPRIFVAPHLAIDTTFASKIVGVSIVSPGFNFYCYWTLLFDDHAIATGGCSRTTDAIADVINPTVPSVFIIFFYPFPLKNLNKFLFLMWIS